MKTTFECKLRGRLGLDDHDMKEIRVLNRIVRINQHGLRYEADPRHAELLAKSMGLIDCKPVATPGVKPIYNEDCHEFPISDDHDLVSSLKPARRSTTRVNFQCDIVVHEVASYSTIYGQHPSQFVFGINGQRIAVKDDEDSFTGVSKSEILARRRNSEIDLAARSKIFRKVLLDGSAWETPSHELIAKMSPKKFKQKRIGAKAAKKAERFESAGEVLNEAEATMFRALAARANYLALDRPEIGYATKELCRYFATPTKTGVEQLKRLVRYLAGAPRLVWKFDFQEDSNELVTYVDTDFGGCHVTRRSTSGGAATRGAHLVKHWSTTQITVALS